VRRGADSLPDPSLGFPGKDSPLPQMCKWNAFTIDSENRLCEDCQRVNIGKNFSHADWGAQRSQ